MTSAYPAALGQPIWEWFELSIFFYVARLARSARIESLALGQTLGAETAGRFHSARTCHWPQMASAAGRSPRQRRAALNRKRFLRSQSPAFGGSEAGRTADGIHEGPRSPTFALLVVQFVSCACLFGFAWIGSRVPRHRELFRLRRSRRRRAKPEPVCDRSERCSDLLQQWRCAWLCCAYPLHQSSGYPERLRISEIP